METCFSCKESFDKKTLVETLKDDSSLPEFYCQDCLDKIDHEYKKQSSERRLRTYRKRAGIDNSFNQIL